MAGRLYRMAKVVSANPKSWGIVDAHEISGFKRVAKLSDLYSIAECILSSSYGDGVTDGADAVGQIWHVSETNGDYKLINWANRKSAAGWDQVANPEEIYNGIVDELTPTVEKVEELENKSNTFETNLNSLKSKVDENKLQIDANAQNIYWVTNHFGQPEGFATLDAHGQIPLKQLGNLDMTVFTVVESLPTSNIENKVYLVRSSLTSDKNNYIEYIYTGDRKGTYDATKWEKLGEVAANISGGALTVDTEMSATSTNAVQNKVIDNAIKTHKINSDNLDGDLPGTDGTDYSILGKNTENGNVSSLAESFVFHFNPMTGSSWLSINGSTVWDDTSLRALTDTELNEILK